MRLLHVIPYYLPAVAFGGPVSVCAGLASAMAARGHTITVLTTDVASRTERVQRPRETIAGVQVVRLRNLSQTLVAANLHTPIGTRRALRELLTDTDVVHIHEFFTWLAYRASQEAARHHTPVLLSGHGSLSIAKERGRTPIKRAWLRTLGEPTIRASTLVQVASAYEADQCARAGVERARIRIVPQGVSPPPRQGDGERFRQRYRLGSRPVFLFVGRLLEGKGVDLLLNAAERLSEHPAEPRFVLVGPAENRPDLERTGPRGTNVLLTGVLKGPDLADAYRAASVFVLPSYAEGMPVTALDALAFGIPCLLSHACNLPQVLDSGAGHLIENTVESLTAGIQHMLTESPAWPQMSRRALRLAIEQFDINQVHAQYEHLYEELKQA